jgi:hypothetical protein
MFPKGRWAGKSRKGKRGDRVHASVMVESMSNNVGGWSGYLGEQRQAVGFLSRNLGKFISPCPRSPPSGSRSLHETPRYRCPKDYLGLAKKNVWSVSFCVLELLDGSRGTYLIVISEIAKYSPNWTETQVVCVSLSEGARPA